MLKLTFYVPTDSSNTVKEAVFAVGAGRIGEYDSCCWEVLGQGQFRPLEGSNPHIGVKGTLEYVQELRVEMVCSRQAINAVIEALKAAHPYETPAYDVVEVLDF